VSEDLSAERVPTPPMKIRWHTPYRADGTGRVQTPEWPPTWPLPRPGDEIELRECALVVLKVIWYPHASDSGVRVPFVYIVTRQAGPHVDED
jgi:hypothetical protein